MQASASYRFTYNHDQWNASVCSVGSTATALNADKTQIFVGGAGADAFTGGDKADLILAGSGADTLTGGAGADAIYGDEDSIVIGSSPALTGAGQSDYKLIGNKGEWSVNHGETIYTLNETQKRLVISGTALGAGNDITITDIDVAKIKSSGYLGITLTADSMAALVETGGSNVWGDLNFDPTSLDGQMWGYAGGKISDASYLELACHGNDYMDNFMLENAIQFIAFSANSTSNTGQFDAQTKAVNDSARQITT
ncbi:MAG: hypothetical protein HHJ12_00265 [Glaciimonas sp.]|nr:hypothetical protein [Glaciimonas sp.]